MNRNEFYSPYPVFDGIEGIGRSSKLDPSVSIWSREGIAIPLNTAKYYMGTSLKREKWARYKEESTLGSKFKLL